MLRRCARRVQGKGAAVSKAADCGRCVALGAADAAHPKATVVVAVYNIERYVGACLESVCAQTERDIEILAVDDGSTDASGAIVAAAAARDGRIRVLTKENGGLSSARNAGIEAARGTVVLFVDGDDLLEPQAVERVLAAFSAHDPDVVTFGARCFPEGAAASWTVECLSPVAGAYEAGDLDVLYRYDTKPYVWRSAFSRRLLQGCDLRFDESLRFGEDMLFYFEAYPQSRRTVVIEDKLYAYRVARTGSLMDASAADLALKVGKHLDIVERIVASWRRRGWLAGRGARLLDWALEFLSRDLFACENGDMNRLAARLGQVLGPCLADGSAEGIDPASRQLLERLASGRPLGALEAKAVLWRYYRHRMGWRFCLDKLRGAYDA
ncbi:glycosyltransferase [Eggerthellaceae bacterium zg-887]|nr:glycosyltransferase [Xiamenia xianingshaonis]